MISKERLDNLKDHYLMKHEDKLQMSKWHPNLLVLFADINKWAWEHGLPLEVTRAIDGMIAGVSKTNIHESARAIDLSVRGWTADQILQCVESMNKKWEHIAAVSSSTGERVACVYHNGQGWHIHAQVKP
jgi:hypothetical protein